MGLTPEDDLYDVGSRFLEPPPKEPAKNRDLRRHLKWMVKEYYRLMG